MKYAEEFIGEYTYFVVWGRDGEKFANGQTIKIESGWHNEEDAIDQLDEILTTGYSGDCPDYEDSGYVWRRNGTPVIVRVLSGSSVNSLLYSCAISIENDTIKEKYTHDNGIYDCENWENIPW